MLSWCYLYIGVILVLFTQRCEVGYWMLIKTHSSAGVVLNEVLLLVMKTSYLMNSCRCSLVTLRLYVCLFHKPPQPDQRAVLMSLSDWFQLMRTCEFLVFITCMYPNLTSSRCINRSKSAVVTLQCLQFTVKKEFGTNWQLLTYVKNITLSYFTFYKIAPYMAFQYYRQFEVTP